MSARQLFLRAVTVAAARARRWKAALIRSNHIGSGTFIDASCQVIGWKNVRIGENCVVSEGVCINVNHRSADTPAVQILDDSFVGRRNFFSSGALIRLGRYSLTGADCKFLGSGHIADPGLPYIASGTTHSDSIIIETNCWIGVGATVLGNVTIGRGSIVGAQSLVMRDIPPFSLAVGSPAKVIKRYDFLAAKWIAVADFTPDHERALPDEALYLTALAAKAGTIRLPKVAAGRRQGELP